MELPLTALIMEAFQCCVSSVEPMIATSDQGPHHLLRFFSFGKGQQLKLCKYKQYDI